MLTFMFVLAGCAGCSDPKPQGVDTGTSNPGDSDNGDSDSGTDSASDSGSDSGKDTAFDSGGDSGDTGTDTGTDTGECVDVDCVVYACYCGDCTDADIQCVTASWANENPCMLECPVTECPELATTVCDCDGESGDCVKR